MNIASILAIQEHARAAYAAGDDGKACRYPFDTPERHIWIDAFVAAATEEVAE